MLKTYRYYTSFCLFCMSSIKYYCYILLWNKPLLQQNHNDQQFLLPSKLIIENNREFFPFRSCILLTLLCSQRIKLATLMKKILQVDREKDGFNIFLNIKKLKYVFSLDLISEMCYVRNLEF